MSEAYAAALATLRRVQTGLAAADTAEERAELLALHDQTLRLLEQSAGRRRVASSALAERLAKLEHSLRDRNPAERRAAACVRLGISRSQYFRLRQSLKHGTT